MAEGRLTHGPPRQGARKRSLLKSESRLSVTLRASWLLFPFVPSAFLSYMHSTSTARPLLSIHSLSTRLSTALPLLSIHSSTRLSTAFPLFFIHSLIHRPSFTLYPLAIHSFIFYPFFFSFFIIVFDFLIHSSSNSYPLFFYSLSTFFLSFSLSSVNPLFLYLLSTPSSPLHLFILLYSSICLSTLPLFVIHSSFIRYQSFNAYPLFQSLSTLHSLSTTLSSAIHSSFILVVVLYSYSFW